MNTHILIQWILVQRRKSMIGNLTPLIDSGIEWEEGERERDRGRKYNKLRFCDYGTLLMHKWFGNEIQFETLAMCCSMQTQNVNEHEYANISTYTIYICICKFSCMHWNLNDWFRMLVDWNTSIIIDFVTVWYFPFSALLRCTPTHMNVCAT